MSFITDIDQRLCNHIQAMAAKCMNFRVMPKKGNVMKLRIQPSIVGNKERSQNIAGHNEEQTVLLK